MEQKTKESFEGTYCINGDLAEIFSEQNDLKISYLGQTMKMIPIDNATFPSSPLVTWKSEL